MKLTMVVLFQVFYLIQINYSQSIKENTLKKIDFDTLKSVDNIFQKEEIEIRDVPGLFMMDIIDYHADIDGGIYMIDRKNLYHFAHNGEFIKKYDKSGSGPSEVKNLNKVLIDKQGNIFLEDLGNQKIIKLTKQFKYLIEFKKKDISPIQDWDVKNGKYLVCFHLFTKPNAIVVYDVNSGELVKKQGKSNELFLKHDAYIGGGGLVIKGNKIYYMSSLEYQIYSTDIDKSRDEVLLKNTPPYFKRISGNMNAAKLKGNNFSFIDDIFLINNNFFVIFYPPPSTGKPNSPFCDIVTLDGKIVKSRIAVKYLVGTKQYGENKFIRVIDLRSYDLEKNKEVRPIKVRLLNFIN